MCFTDAVFTKCNGSGHTGPTDCSSDYAGTVLDGAVSLSSGIQSWTVPSAGVYYFSAYGAQGAAGDPSYVGGRGARVCAAFTLSTGDVLQIAVGQKGSGQSSNSNGGGGGGTFVVRSDDTPLLVAGGGGGTRASVSRDGCDATTSVYGTTGSASSMTHSCPERSDPGSGGAVSGGSWGSGGAGFYGDGYDDYSSGKGLSWDNGMTGGPGDSGCGDAAAGGFGGGGSGRGCHGGGGGGGYSGGEGGRVAGGGGSFIDSSGFDTTSVAGVHEGDGTLIVSVDGCSL